MWTFIVDTQSLQFTDLVFQCHVLNGSYYIARSSESFSIYTVPYYVCTCWQLSKQPSDRHLQYQATTKLSSASDRNYKIYPIAFPIDPSTVCDVSTPFTGDTVSILVRNGTASSAKTTCPTSLWGKYVYQLTDTSGTTSCDYTSWMDVCSSTSTLTINTTLCTDVTLYSSGGTLYCMYSLQDSSASDTYYVYLYNDDATVDDSTTYRFTCIVMRYTSSVTYMTQHPGECLDSASQNATLMATSPGGLYTMYANAPTSSSDNTAIIAAVVVILLLLIIAGIIGGIYYYYRVYLPKKRGLSSKISPDGIPESAMADSLLDYDLTPKQALGEPDGEESGVMLDVEGSLPVYSEAGDTPEPTLCTPVGRERN
ncbi:hypothetical protein ACOMHN_002127 [Nucella lapillus]